MTIRPARFSIDTIGENVFFDGFTTGETWNGWACPYFSFEQAQRVAEAFNKSRRLEGDKVEVRYDAEQDAFCFFFESAEETDDFTSVAIDGKKLYPIGAGCWIWEEVEADTIRG